MPPRPSTSSLRRDVRRPDPVATAEQVAGALRAAARARRRHHQSPKCILREAFQTSSASHADGRVSAAEFVAAALKLGLVIPLKDALAVFHAAGDLVIAPSSTGFIAGALPDALTTDKSEGADPARVNPDDEMLLVYAPWIDDVIEGPRRRPGTAPGADCVGSNLGGAAGLGGVGFPIPAGARPSSSTSGRTRKGPLKEADGVARETDAFVYPQCRTPVFPPRGWGARHAARGVAQPEVTLRLDHVHGCGPGLVDQTAPVPIFSLTTRHSDVLRGNARGEDLVFYAAGVGVVQTLQESGGDGGGDSGGGDYGQTIGGEDDEDGGGDIADQGGRRREALRCQRGQRQRHFRGHDDDIRCVTVHAATRLAASGSMGLEPCAMVWSVDAAGEGEPPLAVLRHPKRSRAVIAVAFDAEGARLATVCGDEGHTLSLWSWRAGGVAQGAPGGVAGGARAGECLWRARGYQSTPPAVRGALFTPDAAAPDLLVTFGTTHVRFWKPELLSPMTKGDEKKGIKKTKTHDVHKPWKVRAGRFASMPVEDVLAAVFLPPASPVMRQRATAAAAAETKSKAKAKAKDVGDGVTAAVDDYSIAPAQSSVSRGCTLITGSPRGELLVWDGGDGSCPARAASGSRHKAPVSALALSADRRRLLSGDASGAVMCWIVDPTEGTLGSPLGGIWLIEIPFPVNAYFIGSKTDRGSGEGDDGGSDGEGAQGNRDDECGDDERDTVSVRWLESYPDIRGLAWSPSGRHALATTAQGSVWRIALDGQDAGGGDDGSGEGSTATPTPTPDRLTSVIIRGHDSSLTCVTWSRADSVSMYATGAASGRVVVWDAVTRREFAAFDAGGPVMSIAFSPDGVHLAAGLDRGVVNVFTVCAPPPRPRALPGLVVVLPRFYTTTAGGLKAAVGALSYSPDGAFLAAGDQLGGLEMYDAISGEYRRRSRCVGHASAVLHADWSADSKVLRTGSTSRETLFHEAPSGKRLTRAPRYHVDAREPSCPRGVLDADVLGGWNAAAFGDTNDRRTAGTYDTLVDELAFRLEGVTRGGWDTWTSPLGFELMGVWPEGYDGTDINGVWRSVDGGYVVSADDTGFLRVMNFPCALEGAPCENHRAHSSHVSGAAGSWCDDWVASAGGRDCCVMQWRVVRKESAMFEKGVDAAAGGGEDFIEDADDVDDNAFQVRADDGEGDVAGVAFLDVGRRGATRESGSARGGVGALKHSKMWRMREEVAARRRRLERELKSLGHGRSARELASAPARERSEWQPAASTGLARHPGGGFGYAQTVGGCGGSRPTTAISSSGATFSEAVSEEWLVEEDVDFEAIVPAR